MRFNEKITTKIILEKRRREKNKVFPVRLRVTQKRTQKYYTINISLTIKEFDEIMQNKAKGDLKNKAMIIFAVEKKALDIINRMESFNFDEFEQKLLNKPADKKSVKDLFSEYITYLKSENRFGTAESYSSTLKSLLTFSKSTDLQFTQITPFFLKKYESWSLKQGKSITTIGIYLRTLRAIFNLAIEKQYITTEKYPFGKRKYIIPTTKNIKKALSKQNLIKLYHYKPEEGSLTEFSKDLWFFSYFCNGMNFADILELKHENILEDRIIFHRKKTINTQTTKKAISIMLNDEINAIIQKWCTIPTSEKDFVFDILKPEMTAIEKHKRIKQTIQNTNKHLKKIAGNIGLDKNITTVWARHTYSTTLKNEGASIEYISESLGHSNMQTTKHYLDSFNDDIKKEHAQKLSDIFKTKE